MSVKELGEEIRSGAAAARAFASRADGAWIAGERVTALDGGRLAVHDPATEDQIAEVPNAGPATVDAAVRSARTAFDDGRWSRLAPGDRARVVAALADAVETHAEELAALEALDNGKAIKEARGDVAGTVAVLRYYAGWPTKLAGEVHATDPRFVAYTVREPVGVCGQVIPWNYPLLMASWKVGPALAAGNCAVLKPAEQTPLSALRLAELARDAGLPAGVLNVAPGDGATGAALVAHAGVDKVAFTGSTEVGKAVMRSAADTVKRVTLELGGKNPNVVFADADLDRAVEGALAGAFENGGQACIAGSRVLVERGAHDAFVERLVARTGELRVGPGLDEATDLGAVVDETQREGILGHVRAAAGEGARLVVGGTRTGDRGHFLEPAVLTGTTPAMRIWRDEVFGPVVTVTPFDTADEAVALANDTRYGLAAAVWTRDAGRGMALARRIRAGTIWINAYGSIRPEVPFGGFGQSGLGRELGALGLDAYTEPKSVFVDLS